MTATMPTSVTIGPFTYRVTDDPADWATLDNRDREDCYGYTLHTAARIYLMPDLEPAFKRVILLHELLHVAAFASGQLTTAKRDEEAWVAMAAPPLLDALLRSPGLIEWLRS